MPGVGDYYQNSLGSKAGGMLCPREGINITGPALSDVRESGTSAKNLNDIKEEFKYLDDKLLLKAFRIDLYERLAIYEKSLQETLAKNNELIKLVGELRAELAELKVKAKDMESTPKKGE